MRRVLQSNVELPLNRAYCDLATGIVVQTRGDLCAAACHLAIAESAGEADRRAAVMSEDGQEEQPADELLDDMLHGIRNTVERLPTLHPSAIPDEVFRCRKVATTIQTAECSNWHASADTFRAAYEGASPAFAQRSHCLLSFTKTFQDEYDVLSPPGAGDLAFMRGIFESDAKGSRKASGETVRRAIALAGSATEAECSVSALLGGIKEAFIGDLLDGYLCDLRYLLTTVAVPECTVPIDPSVPGDEEYKRHLPDISPTPASSAPSSSTPAPAITAKRRRATSSIVHAANASHTARRHARRRHGPVTVIVPTAGHIRRRRSRQGVDPKGCTGPHVPHSRDMRP
ncbi:hypothetical protein BDK51DRAFT_38227 [Blyttiomyces helicus]|uniref:Uncharacterized protein n=1 Tax=Blyttiomyces helicus TaxID=388810 RepID=A0A4P9W9Y4_9FUNG|nr:hypothetical protein BDK51DRAFT_38227 [Blyttiomyces helicus]|eukprot:RKO89012.1 hypothetical protein BDK51DRAFT_38227 [Blyttiomyces helicus]